MLILNNRPKLCDHKSIYSGVSHIRMHFLTCRYVLIPWLHSRNPINSIHVYTRIFTLITVETNDPKIHEHKVTVAVTWQPVINAGGHLRTNSWIIKKRQHWLQHCLLAEDLPPSNPLLMTLKYTGGEDKLTLFLSTIQGSDKFKPNIQYLVLISLGSFAHTMRFLTFLLTSPCPFSHGHDW